MIYETKGTLTGTIEPENVSRAQAYLTDDDMTQYLDDELKGIVLFQQWQLDADGHHYKVIAVTSRELTEDELKLLASNTSGQNSDGLGESFEQQDFAETHDEDSEEDCGDCGGRGTIEKQNGTYVSYVFEDECDRCAGAGFVERENYGMISFDWQTNDSTYTLVS